MSVAQNKQLGYVKIYRQLLDSEVFCNADLLKVWIWCLLKATHRDRWVSVRTGRGETQVGLQAGQFLFGRKSAAKKLKMPESSVNDRMKKLQGIGCIKIEPYPHFSIITILNWTFYQDAEKTPKKPKYQRPSVMAIKSDTNTDTQPDTQPDTHPTPIRHRQEC